MTPSHQFPLGMPMSQERRVALLAKAHELGAIIIEDDYDSEFRYEGRPTDSLQSMDERGIVAYVGTFSKTLLPELRLGYAILPPAILDAVVRAKQLTDLHTSTLPQWALAKFIAEGCLLKHIRRCHTIYAGRRDRILARIATDLSPWLEAVPTTAGFHMVVLCKVPIDVPLVIELAKKSKSGSTPSTAFSTSRRRWPGFSSVLAPLKPWTSTSPWIACGTSCSKSPDGLVCDFIRRLAIGGPGVQAYPA